jgi:hypothetical protein
MEEYMNYYTGSYRAPIILQLLQSYSVNRMHILSVLEQEHQAINCSSTG